MRLSMPPGRRGGSVFNRRESHHRRRSSSTTSPGPGPAAEAVIAASTGQAVAAPTTSQFDGQAAAASSGSVYMREEQRLAILRAQQLTASPDRKPGQTIIEAMQETSTQVARALAPHYEGWDPAKERKTQLTDVNLWRYDDNHRRLSEKRSSRAHRQTVQTSINDDFVAGISTGLIEPAPKLKMEKHGDEDTSDEEEEGVHDVNVQPFGLGTSAGRRIALAGRNFAEGVQIMARLDKDKELSQIPRGSAATGSGASASNLPWSVAAASRSASKSRNQGKTGRRAVFARASALEDETQQLESAIEQGIMEQERRRAMYWHPRELQEDVVGLLSDLHADEVHEFLSNQQDWIAGCVDSHAEMPGQLRKDLEEAFKVATELEEASEAVDRDMPQAADRWKSSLRDCSAIGKRMAQCLKAAHTECIKQGKLLDQDEALRVTPEMLADRDERQRTVQDLSVKLVELRQQEEDSSFSNANPPHIVELEAQLAERRSMMETLKRDFEVVNSRTRLLESALHHLEAPPGAPPPNHPVMVALEEIKAKVKKDAIEPQLKRAEEALNLHEGEDEPEVIKLRAARDKLRASLLEVQASMRNMVHDAAKARLRTQQLPLAPAVVDPQLPASEASYFIPIFLGQLQTIHKDLASLIVNLPRYTALLATAGRSLDDLMSARQQLLEHVRTLKARFIATEGLHNAQGAIAETKKYMIQLWEEQEAKVSEEAEELRVRGIFARGLVSEELKSLDLLRVAADKSRWAAADLLQEAETSDSGIAKQQDVSTVGTLLRFREEMEEDKGELLVEKQASKHSRRRSIELGRRLTAIQATTQQKLAAAQNYRKTAIGLVAAPQRVGLGVGVGIAGVAPPLPFRRDSADDYDAGLEADDGLDDSSECESSLPDDPSTLGASISGNHSGSRAFRGKTMGPTTSGMRGMTASMSTSRRATAKEPKLASNRKSRVPPGATSTAAPKSMTKNMKSAPKAEPKSKTDTPARRSFKKVTSVSKMVRTISGDRESIEDGKRKGLTRLSSGASLSDQGSRDSFSEAATDNKPRKGSTNSRSSLAFESLGVWMDDGDEHLASVTERSGGKPRASIETGPFSLRRAAATAPHPPEEEDKSGTLLQRFERLFNKPIDGVECSEDEDEALEGQPGSATHLQSGNLKLQQEILGRIQHLRSLTTLLGGFPLDPERLLQLPGDAPRKKEDIIDMMGHLISDRKAWFKARQAAQPPSWASAGEREEKACEATYEKLRARLPPKRRSVDMHRSSLTDHHLPLTEHRRSIDRTALTKVGEGRQSLSASVDRKEGLRRPSKSAVEASKSAVEALDVHQLKESVVKIQKVLRGKKARQEAMNLKKVLSEAAVKIQSIHRGRFVRKLVTDTIKGKSEDAAAGSAPHRQEAGAEPQEAAPAHLAPKAKGKKRTTTAEPGDRRGSFPERHSHNSLSSSRGAASAKAGGQRKGKKAAGGGATVEGRGLDPVDEKSDGATNKSNDHVGSDAE